MALHPREVPLVGRSEIDRDLRGLLEVPHRIPGTGLGPKRVEAVPLNERGPAIRRQARGSGAEPRSLSM